MHALLLSGVQRLTFKTPHKSRHSGTNSEVAAAGAAGVTQLGREASSAPWAAHWARTQAATAVRETCWLGSFPSLPSTICRDKCFPATGSISLPLSPPSPPQGPAAPAQPHQGWDHKHDSRGPAHAVRLWEQNLPTGACDRLCPGIFCLVHQFLAGPAVALVLNKAGIQLLVQQLKAVLQLPGDDSGHKQGS